MADRHLHPPDSFQGQLVTAAPPPPRSATPTPSYAPLDKQGARRSMGTRLLSFPLPRSFRATRLELRSLLNRARAFLATWHTKIMVVQILRQSAAVASVSSTLRGITPR